MSLYPALTDETVNPQTFRLNKIGEMETFLRSEINSRSRLHKKYRRAVNTLDGACATLGTACVATGAAGAGLLASGIGLIPGIALEVIASVVGLLDVVGVAISRKCSTKARKHETISILASSKLDTVHSHISKALEDCDISDDEYRLVLEEAEKYRTMKEEIRRKSAPSAGSVINEKTKNELVNRGREQARASFIRKLTTSESP